MVRIKQVQKIQQQKHKQADKQYNKIKKTVLTLLQKGKINKLLWMSA
jgi:hypothetical protein